MTVEDIEPIQVESAQEEQQAINTGSEGSNENKTFNQRQVSDVVKRERERAYEKGRKDALMQMQQQQQEPAQVQPIQQQPVNSQGLGGMSPLMTPEDISRMIAEQAPQALQAQFQQLKQDHMVNNFVTKMQAAEAKHPGLEAELNQLNYNDPRMHTFIEMANSQENTADIMKEVLDNPHKLEDLLSMSASQPYMAQKAMQRLSQSIKMNDDAKSQESQARDPMSQLKPSTTAGNDSGSMSVRDFQKMFKSKA